MRCEPIFACNVSETKYIRADNMNRQNLLTRLFVVMLIASQISCQQKSKIVNTVAADNFRFLEYDITAIQKGYADKSFTVKEVVKAYLDRIETIDKNGPALNSIIEVNPDALQIAEELDREMASGKSRGPLHGIPVILKDNIDTHDKMPTTAGSRALANSHPLKDSYVAQRLRDAGAVIIAKANLSEWANFRGDMSSSGWSGEGGQTKNPYILSRNPCGSSSGSGVAVSANLTMVAIGTETNGSIVCPSNNNGIVGIKPTVGLVSRSGVIPISFTQDTPGPMARTVKDAAILLGAITGIDLADTKTLGSEGKYFKDYTQFLNPDGLKGKKIGLYKPAIGINYKVDTLMSKAIDFMKSKGAVIIDIPEILTGDVEKSSLTVMLYEYKDGLNKYFTSLGHDAPVKTIEELISFNKNDTVELRYFNQRYLEVAAKKGSLESDEYKSALATMTKGSREMGIDMVMNQYSLDAIVAPTGSPAWETDLVNGDYYQLGTSSPAAIAGYPAITVPMGFIDRLPVGISFFGRAWGEPGLIEIAYAYETGTRHRKAPRFLSER
jgi:amidase